MTDPNEPEEPVQTGFLDDNDPEEETGETVVYTAGGGDE